MATAASSRSTFVLPVHVKLPSPSGVPRRAGAYATATPPANRLMGAGGALLAFAGSKFCSSGWRWHERRPGRGDRGRTPRGVAQPAHHNRGLDAVTDEVVDHAPQPAVSGPKRRHIGRRLPPGLRLHAVAANPIPGSGGSLTRCTTSVAARPSVNCWACMAHVATRLAAWARRLENTR